MITNIPTLAQHIISDRPTRILAFGSSNTQRLHPGMHWFDCFELSLHQKFNTGAYCINTGIGGNSTRDLLARFETDAAFYQPHAAFVTIGGNDSAPDRDLSEAEFEGNLQQLWERFNAIGAHVIFQTYYSVMLEGQHFENFKRYMEIVRKVARENQATLIDHFERWERLRLQRSDLYMPLMQDAMHLNSRGNCVMGLDIARVFDCDIEPNLAFWGEALYIQQVMDQLAVESSQG